MWVVSESVTPLMEYSLHDIRKVYDQALEEAFAELGLDARGVAAYKGWDVEASVLRNVLRRLRGICTHPQVGRISRILGLSRELVLHRLDNCQSKARS